MYLGKVIVAKDIDLGIVWLAAAIETLQLVEIYKEDSHIREAFRQHPSQESFSPLCGSKKWYIPGHRHQPESRNSWFSVFSLDDTFIVRNIFLISISLGQFLNLFHLMES